MTRDVSIRDEGAERGRQRVAEAGQTRHRRADRIALRSDRRNETNQRTIRATAPDRVERQIRAIDVLARDDAAAALVPVQDGLPVLALLDDHAIDRDGRR